MIAVPQVSLQMLTEVRHMSSGRSMASSNAARGLCRSPVCVDSQPDWVLQELNAAMLAKHVDLALVHEMPWKRLGPRWVEHSRRDINKRRLPRVWLRDNLDQGGKLGAGHLCALHSAPYRDGPLRSQHYLQHHAWHRT